MKSSRVFFWLSAMWLSLVVIVGACACKDQFLFASRDPLWDDYTEVREWHEVGAPDPRYLDPFGPGPHVGQLGEPGCL